MVRWLPLFALVFLLSRTSAGQVSPAPVDQLIPWLLDEGSQLREISFGKVIADVTGRKVLAFDPKNEVDQRVVKGIGAACEETMKRLNTPESAVQRVGRINEVSSHFEDSLRELINSAPGLSCDFPKTAEGKVQRSGYPDLRIVDLASKRVYYLDPKLYAAGSRDSSFRTFYFEPKIATNKVRDDAVHFVAGFEHEARIVAAPLPPSPSSGVAGSRGGSEEGSDAPAHSTSSGQAPRPESKSGAWKFSRWDLVDLSQFKVRLKAEFQGSNRDLYRAEAIVSSSDK